MFQMRVELARLKHQTSANATAMETLAAFVKQAMRLEQLPASRRTLQSRETTRLFRDHGGRMWLRNQPYRGEFRDHKCVSCIARRCLFVAVQKFLRSRSALTEETFPFLTNRLGTTSDAQHLVPRSASQLHAVLKESGTVPVAV